MFGQLVMNTVCLCTFACVTCDISVSPARFVRCEQCDELCKLNQQIFRAIDENDDTKKLCVPTEVCFSFPTLILFILQINAYLSAYVIGQAKAKEMLSVSIYNHYKRVQQCPRPIMTSPSKQQQPLHEGLLFLRY
jgi:ATP-dependent protease Clp ATPase subunit